MPPIILKKTHLVRVNSCEHNFFLLHLIQAQQNVSVFSLFYDKTVQHNLIKSNYILLPPKWIARTASKSTFKDKHAIKMLCCVLSEARCLPLQRGKKIHTEYFLQTAHRYGTVGSYSECLTDKMFWKRNFQRWYEIKCVILLFPTEDTDSEL